jgi:hypothetical protein
MYKTVPAEPGGLRCLSYEKSILANASARGVGLTRERTFCNSYRPAARG